MTVNVSSAFCRHHSSSILTWAPPDTQVVSFMRQLADNPPQTEMFLAVLGNGNWGAARKSAPTADDGGLLPIYLGGSGNFFARGGLPS